MNYSNQRLWDKIYRYRKHFEEPLPLCYFMSASDNAIIDIIDKCLKDDKKFSPYDFNYVIKPK